MNKELLLEVRRKYYLLNLINPRHELLRYFVLDEEDNTFTPIDDEKLEYEFINRFRGEIMSVEDYVKLRPGPYEEYLQELYGSLFSNYRSLLEEEINKIEMRN